MEESIKETKHHISKRDAILIGLICICIGFLMGVGFASFRLNKEKITTTKTSPSIDYGKKEKELKAFLAKEPDNARAWIQLGHIYYETDQLAKAIEAYQSSIALVPGDANVLTDLGVLYRINKQPLKAVEAFDQAIAADPSHERARLNKGGVLMNDLNEKKKALEVWEELLEINPIAMAGKNQSLDELIRHYKEH
tara:strand:- start:570 stop:1154 length:585 start_codon:yes stop_codon:yes gene_type:complete